MLEAANLVETKQGNRVADSLLGRFGTVHGIGASACRPRHPGEGSPA